MVIRATNLAFTRPLVPRKTTSRIILHHTAGGDVSAHTIHDWHLPKKGWGGIGYHYLIRADGTAERGRPEHVRGVHASAANADSIGIALTGNFETRPPTSAQMASLVRLIRDIRDRYQTQAMSAEDRRTASNLRADIARVSARAADPTARAWFEREHGGIDAYLDVQRRRLAAVLAKTPVLAVVGHSGVGATACPGRLFPWADLHRRIQ